MYKCLNMCTYIYILIHIIALCIRGRSCLPNRSWNYKKCFSLQYGAINAKFENNQINTQPKYDHYQFNWPLATKNRPNQLTVPVWTEPNSNRTDGGCSWVTGNRTEPNRGHPESNKKIRIPSIVWVTAYAKYQ